MATELKKGPSIEVNTIAADWDYGAVYTAAKNPRIIALTFIPGDAADKIVVKDGSDTGPVIFKASCVLATDEKVKYFHGEQKRPYVDFDLCTLSAGHKFLIDLKAK